MGKTIFVTGAGGFVGSHSVLELLQEGYDIVAVDNYVNAVKGDGVAMPESLRRVEKYTKKKIIFYEVDLCDKKTLKAYFSKVNSLCDYGIIRGVFLIDICKKTHTFYAIKGCSLTNYKQDTEFVAMIFSSTK